MWRQLSNELWHISACLIVCSHVWEAETFTECVTRVNATLRCQCKMVAFFDAKLWVVLWLTPWSRVSTPIFSPCPFFCYVSDAFISWNILSTLLRILGTLLPDQFCFVTFIFLFHDVFHIANTVRVSGSDFFQSSNDGCINSLLVLHVEQTARLTNHCHGYQQVDCSAHTDSQSSFCCKMRKGFESESCFVW